MSRSGLGITTQIGVQTDYDTGATANRQLVSMGITFGPQFLMNFYRMAGRKFPTSKVKHREWAAGQANGILNFNEIQYILAGLFGHGSVTQIGTTGAYTWPISPSTSAQDTHKYYTIQRGDSEAAQEVSSAVFTSLTIDFSPNEIRVTSDILGRSIDNGATLDSSPTVLTEATASIADLDWYLDSSYSAVTGGSPTKLTDVRSGRLVIPAKVTPVFVQNTSYRSIRDVVEVAVEDARLTLTATYNSQMRAIYDAMNADSLPTRYVQSRIVGDNIGTNADYTFKGNYAVAFEGATELGENDILGYEFNFRIVDDGTRALDFTVINTRSAL